RRVEHETVTLDVAGSNPAVKANGPETPRGPATRRGRCWRLTDPLCCTQQPHLARARGTRRGSLASSLSAVRGPCVSSNAPESGTSDARSHRGVRAMQHSGFRRAEAGLHLFKPVPHERGHTSLLKGGKSPC